METIRADWRLAWRSIRRSPLFTGVALVIVAVSIALSTAVFSLVSGVLLRPLPYPNAERLVRLGEIRPNAAGSANTSRLLASVTIGEWMRQSETLDAIVPYSANGTTRVEIGGTNHQLVAARVGGRFFDVLGETPAAGRLLNESDDRSDAPPVAVVSWRLSQQIGDLDDTPGRVITIEGVPHTVAGVAPADLAFPSPDVDVWVPGRWTFAMPGAGQRMMMRIAAIARMHPASTVDEVRREAERVLLSIAMADPAFADGTVPVPRPYVASLHDEVVGDTRPALQALFAGMVLVFVAACVSLANLIVARNTARERDIAIRTTLGATRRRLLIPLAMEQVALVGGGAVLGALAGRWILGVLPSIAPERLPRLSEVRFDPAAFTIVAAAALLTALAVGLRPAWRKREGELREVSATSRLLTRSGSRSAELVRGSLVASQVALAIVLLTGAALIARSLLNLVTTHPGYDPSGVLTFQVGMGADAWQERGRQTRFYEELMERVRALEHVTAAGFASHLPLHTAGMSGTFFIEGQPRPSDPADHPRARHVMISPEYHRALGTRLLAGRGFNPQDDADAAPVAIVDELLARRHFGGDALGGRVRSIAGKTWTIVGVVESVKLGSVSAAGEPIMYMPYSQVGESLTFSRLGMGMLVRTASEPTSIGPAVRQIVADLDRSAPIYNLMPLDERLSATFDGPRFYTIALALFAVLTVATAALGVYGVQAYAVERRRTEFGVRRALGARESDITRLVLTRALLLGLAGAAIGIPLAAAGAGLLETLLFGVRPIDPLTFAVVPVVVLLLSLAASWQPARRALRVDPSTALRCD